MALLTGCLAAPSGQDDDPSDGEVELAVRITGPDLCRTGQAISLGLAGAPPYPCTWSARDGRISGSADSAVYVAPETPGSDLLRVTFDVSGTPFEVNREVLVYRQFIILKADDLGVATPRWEQYLGFLRDAGLSGTVGVVWSQLQQPDPAWVQYLLELEAAGLCEFFHHGWDHASGENLDGTAPGTAMWEFRGTGYAYQRQHLRAGLAVADSLGFRVTAFGAPFNKTDQTTAQVLDEVPAIRSVFFDPSGGNRIRFSRVVDIENGTGKPDLAFFEPQYRAHQEEEYLVLQVHPNAIEEVRFPEFERIIALLKAEGRTFITAEEYRRLDESRRPASP
jgi:peptidoglycan/xylan/chitin deacetylase (PgdA/CDA1 family)